jgi:hypothetical protein
MKLKLLEEWSQSEARYTLMVRYWSKLLLSIICYIIIHERGEVLKVKTENLSKYWEIKGRSSNHL